MGIWINGGGNVRILFVNQFYIPDVAATGQLLADVAEELAAQGHQVHVICSRRTYTGGATTFAANELINGVHVHRVGATGFGRTTAAGRMVDWLSFYLLALWRALVMPKMDVCVSLTTPPLISLVGLVLSKLKGTQSVIWVMDVYPDIAVAYDVLPGKGISYRLLSRVNRVLLRNAAAVISLGEVMTERLQSSGVLREKLHTVHNWVPGETAGWLESMPVARWDLLH
jgi:colanic acid biosynthesis glycosyl transferase WcaI